MKLVSALIGLVALGGVALSTSAASAMPIARADDPSQVTNMQRANYTCNGWGHCWHRWHSYYGDGGGYYHPHYWGGGGWGWHRWHAGWGGGYGWHHWHQW